MFKVLEGSFWENVGNFFVNLWNEIVKFFTVPDSSGLSNGSRLIIAFFFLVIAWFLVKLFIKFLRKIFKINEVKVKRKKKVFNQKTKKFDIKYEVVDNSLRRYVITSLSVLLKFLVFLGFLAIIKVDLTGFATIISSALLAVGLSMQDFIKNFFAGLVILYNRYISLGDYVSVYNGEAEGVVHEIKAFSTILNNFDGQQLIVPNGLILNNVSKNFDNNPYRRVVIKIGVSYEANINLAKELLLSTFDDDPRIIKTIESKKPSVVLDSFDQSAVILSLRMYTKKDNYWSVFYEYNEKVLRILRDNNILISYNLLTNHKKSKEIFSANLVERSNESKIKDKKD